MITTVAYIPFLDPVHALLDWWYLLLVPLALGISMIYRAIRMNNLDRFWRSAGIMTTQIVLAMAALAIALVILIRIAIPLLPVP